MPEKHNSSFLMSDKNIFLRLKKKKDKQAFLIAYDLYVDQIYRFIFFKIGQKEDAQDLTSQVFVKCWSYVLDGKLNDSNDYRSLKSFLYKIARNIVIDYYRQDKKDIDLEQANNLVDEHELDQEVEQKIDFELLQDKFVQLKSEYRGIIIMRYINQLSISEIADILGKNKTNVRVTLFRAIEALKKILS